MVHERVRRIGSPGFTMTELVVVVAVAAVLMTLSMPTFLTYWKNATLKGGAQEVVATLNTARQLAIKENTSVCVTSDTGSGLVSGYGSKFQFYVSSACSGSAWTGAGTDSSGWMPLSTSVVVKPPTGNIVFTYLGAASTAGTWKVCNPSDTNTHAQVTVAASGRISISYVGSAC